MALAAHYHSVRTLSPRFPEDFFEVRQGGCYFRPDESLFSETPIEPFYNEVEGMDDPLAEVVDIAADYGLDVDGWTVYLHNSRLGHEYPAYQLEDAFGNSHEHAFCPSHPEVRAYFSAVTRAVANSGVKAVEAESPGFPTVFHGHDTRFGHPKRQVLTSDAELRLFSQCFCDACRRRGRERGVDMDEPQALIRDLIRESFERPHSDPPALGDLTQRHEPLQDLFKLREAIVSDLVGDVAAAARATGAEIDCYVWNADTTWQSGLTLDVLEDYADRLTVLCYHADPDVVRERLRLFSRRTDLPLNAGLSLDTTFVENERKFRTLVETVRSEIDGHVRVYNHALLTDAQLDWVADAFD